VYQQFDDFERSSAGGDVVWDCQSIPAGCASDPKFGRAVIVALLLDHGVVIDDVPEAVFGDVGEADRNNCIGVEETNKFVGFSSFPLKFIWTIFSRAIGERLAVDIQIESGWYISFGDGKHGCIGSTVSTEIAADAFGRGSTSPVAEVVFVDRLWRDRVGGPQNSTLWGLWYRALC
jgi:hypothetical protein